MENTLTQPAAGVTQPKAARFDERGSLAGSAGLCDVDFDQLVREHQQRIYRILLATLRDPDAAETLTQECFLRAYRKRGDFRGEARVGTWLVRIALNLAKDHRRNRRNAFWARLFSTQQPAEDAAAFDVPARQASPERQLAAREELRAVWAAATELPQQQRSVFLLRFAEELTLEEIAEAMELDVGTVKTHLFRGVSAVRRRFRKEA